MDEQESQLVRVLRIGFSAGSQQRQIGT